MLVLLMTCSRNFLTCERRSGAVKTKQVTLTHTRQEQTHNPQTNTQTNKTDNGVTTA